MIKFKIPKNNYAKIKYILYVFFEYWGKQECVYEMFSEKYIECKINTKYIYFYSYFFENDLNHIDFTFRKSFDLNSQFLTLLSPFNYGIWSRDKFYQIDLDIFGSAFILLTGLEAFQFQKLDKFGRFEGKKSKLIDLVERPIVQEYYLFLKAFLRKFDVFLFQPQFKVTATHDVDHPYAYYKLDKRHFLKNCLGDIMLRKKLPIQRIINFHKIKSTSLDPFNTFSYFLENEQNIESIYYFFAGKFNVNNPDYNWNDEHIQQVAEKLSKESTIGLHCGLNAYQSSEQVKREISNFGYKTPKIRFHFLSFDVRKTVSILAENKIEYDSTFAYRDIIGFRSGSCYPFPLFDLVQDAETKVIEHPLLFMESTILNNPKRYREPKKSVAKIIERTKQVGGEFVFLWHNHRILSKKEKELYQFVLASTINN